LFHANGAQHLKERICDNDSNTGQGKYSVDMITREKFDLLEETWWEGIWLGLLTSTPTFCTPSTEINNMTVTLNCEGCFQIRRLR